LVIAGVAVLGSYVFYLGTYPDQLTMVELFDGRSVVLNSEFSRSPSQSGIFGQIA